MTPHKQIFPHRPELGIYGDCFRTAIACIMDLDPAQVPHFTLLHPDDGTGAYMQAARRWLEHYNATLLQIGFEGASLHDVLETVGACNPDLYYMLCGASSRGVNQNVICINDIVVWDPSLDDSGVVQPASDGRYWVNFFAVRV